MSDTDLHHLLNRAIDGVVLHGESDRLRGLVRGLEQRAKQAEAEAERVQQAACRTAESLRKAERAVNLLADSHRRAEQAEAALERVLASVEVIRANGVEWAAASIERALDEPQPSSTTA
ncbi:hypothetical protein OG911_28105 [Streptomyces sp. NBC_00208]|uniref:hypothetical protein n=1 Tax=Streptomyces sp. NBC_00208 TaxID=2975681 RepID=UPI002E2BF7DC|nr:hypothetical protein [Streptomyces sp. NBC_00208]